MGCEGIGSLNILQSGVTLSGEVFRSDMCEDPDRAPFTVDSRAVLVTRDGVFPASGVRGNRVQLTGIGPFSNFLMCSYTGIVTADGGMMSGEAVCVLEVDSMIHETMRGTWTATRS